MMTRLPARLVLALTGLTLALGLAEAALRLHPVVPAGARRGLDARNDDNACIAPSPTRGWAPLPDRCGRDALGTRPAGGGGPGAWRLLVLGDSIAGQHVWVEAAVAVLERRHPVDARNAGVSGYDPCHALFAWRELAPTLRPDAVLLQLCPNDLTGSPVLSPGAPGWVRFHLGERPEDRRALEVPEVALRSAVLTTALLSLAPALSRPDGGAPAEQTVGRCLVALRDEVGATRAELRALLFPTLSPLDAPSEAERMLLDQERRLEALSHDLGIPTLNLRGSLPDDPTPLRVSPDDHLHPTPDAQRALGPVVAAWIAAGG